MSADTVLPDNVVWTRKTVAASGFSQRVAVDAAPKAPQSGEFSDKEKLAQQLARRQVSGESADRIKQEYVHVIPILRLNSTVRCSAFIPFLCLCLRACVGH